MSNKRLLNEFSFGFELEGTYNHHETTSRSLKSKFDELLCGEGSMHGDGSLRAEIGYSTFEYASPVFKFTPQNVNMVINFLDSLPSLYVKINRTCGFHTHISFKGITKKDAVWAMASMAIDGSYENFLKLGRTNLHRAPYAKPTFLHKAHEYAENGDMRRLVDTIVDNEKYRSIRIHPQGTIEWRGPRTFLNTISHNKNVAFFKKLAKFIKRINDSLDMDCACNITKEAFLARSVSHLNNLSFKEENTSYKVQRVIDTINTRSEVLNHLSANTFNKLYDASRNMVIGINIDNVIRNLKSKNIKITSSEAIKFLMSYSRITNFITLIDAETFKNNIALIGQHNGLTPTFEYLLRNPGVNDEVLNVLINQALTKFGHSSIKTFSYNAMLEMIKYNINAFKVATRINLKEVFGYERARNLVYNVINTDRYGFRNTNLYTMLINSENESLVRELIQEPNYQTNDVLNTTLMTLI